MNCDVSLVVLKLSDNLYSVPFNGYYCNEGMKAYSPEAYTDCNILGLDWNIYLNYVSKKTLDDKKIHDKKILGDKKIITDESNLY